MAEPAGTSPALPKPEVSLPLGSIAFLVGTVVVLGGWSLNSSPPEKKWVISFSQGSRYDLPGGTDAGPGTVLGPACPGPVGLECPFPVPAPPSPPSPPAPPSPPPAPSGLPRPTWSSPFSSTLSSP